MSNAYQLRAGQSGPAYDGNPGDVLTLQSGGLSKFLPSSGGGGLPLTKEFWVDPGRTTSTQDGSAGQPFKTVQAALDALGTPGGTLLLADGDYNGQEWTITQTVVYILALGKSLVTPASVTISGGGYAQLQNITPDELEQADGTLFLVGGFYAALGLSSGVNLFGTGTSFGDITAPDSLSALVLRSCLVDNVLGVDGARADSVIAFDTTFTNDLEAEHVTLKSSTLDGTLTAFTAKLEQSTVQEVVIEQTLTADTFSIHALRVGSASSPPAVQMLVSDHPSTQAIVTVPPLTASTADVTVNGAGFFAKEGDTFDCSLANSGPVPRLAGIGIIASWVKPDGNFVLRFFGTTAGGSQLVDLNINQNSP